MPSPTACTIPIAAGQDLAAQFFHPGDDPRAAVLIVGAMGVTQSFAGGVLPPRPHAEAVEVLVDFCSMWFELRFLPLREGTDQIVGLGIADVEDLKYKEIAEILGCPIGKP